MTGLNLTMKRSKKRSFRRMMLDYPYLMSLMVCLFLLIVNGIFEPRSLGFEGLLGTLNSYLPLMIVAMGQTYVVFAGDIDLSVGSIISLVNVATVALIAYYGSGYDAIGIGILCGLGIGVACGFFNGICIAVFRFQPIVTTFATGVIFGGLALWIMPNSGMAVPEYYWDNYAGEVLGIPFVILILIFMALLITIIARHKFTLLLKAIGDDIQPAFQTGLPVVQTRIKGYMMCGLFAAISSLCLTGDTASGDPLLGVKTTLLSVAAVVLGGTALSGGSGSTIGSAVGALIIGLIGSVVFFAGISYEYQNLVQGLIVLLALAGGVMVSKR
ncbi:MAG: sugar ABC transporter permease [Dehalococcoidales bacterium]|nr:sugar ABC transporter permease [Dehalococcoidales bacterium]